VAEPDLRRGVRALKNTFGMRANLTSDERRDLEMRYQRDVAPRVESITNTYDRITKRLNDREIADLKKKELEASIAKLKGAQDQAKAAENNLSKIQESFNKVRSAISTIDRVPDPEDDSRAVPASIAQMRENLSRAREMYSDFGLRSLINQDDNRVALEGMFEEQFTQGAKKITNAESFREERAGLMADYDDVLLYHKGFVADKDGKGTPTPLEEVYEKAFDTFQRDRNVNAFRRVLSVGKKDLGEQRARVLSRIKRADELYDKVTSKRKFMAATMEQKLEDQLGGLAAARAINDPIFVRSVYKDYLSLLGDLSEEEFKEKVGVTKDQAKNTFEVGQPDTVMEKASRSPFDQFADTLYQNIIDYLSEERDNLEDTAVKLGVSTIPSDAGATVSPEKEDKAKDLFPKD